MSININPSVKTYKVSVYQVLFEKAQENFALVCQEYKNTSLCQKHKRTRRTSTLKAN